MRNMRHFSLRHASALLAACLLAVACSARNVEGDSSIADRADGPLIVEKILVIGDSISMGAGAVGAGPNCELGADSDSLEVAYPTRVAATLGADLSLLAWSGKGLVRNYDGSTTRTISELITKSDTSPLPISEDAPQLIMIHIGTHDFYTNNPEPDFSIAYLKLLGTLSGRYEGARIFTMFGPMLHGEDAMNAENAIQNVVQQLRANGNEHIHYLRFQTGEGYVPGCAWHPSESAHEMMADEILANILSTN